MRYFYLLVNIQFKFDSERQISEKLFHERFQRKSPKKYYLFHIAFWCLTYDMNPIFTFYKKTHLLDYGDFIWQYLCKSTLSQNSTLLYRRECNQLICAWVTLGIVKIANYKRWCRFFQKIIFSNRAYFHFGGYVNT